MAPHDALTGLPNRSLLMDRIENAIAGAERNKGQAALMFIDLDGFKAVNDTSMNSHSASTGGFIRRHRWDIMLITVRDASYWLGLASVLATLRCSGPSAFSLIARDRIDTSGLRKQPKNFEALVIQQTNRHSVVADD